MTLLSFSLSLLFLDTDPRIQEKVNKMRRMAIPCQFLSYMLRVSDDPGAAVLCSAPTPVASLLYYARLQSRDKRYLPQHPRGEKINGVNTMDGLVVQPFALHCVTRWGRSHNATASHKLPSRG